MFKNETLVKLVVCTQLIFSPLAVMANPPAQPIFQSTGNPCGDLAKLVADRQRELGDYRIANPTAGDGDQGIVARKKNVEDARTELKSCNSQIQNSGNQCPDGHIGAFNKAKGEFATACRGMPEIPIDDPANPGTPGNIACGHAVARCSCPGMDSATESYQKLQCSDGPSVGGAGEAPNGGRNIVAARAQFHFCPILAAADIKDAEKELREAQKEVRDLEKKVSELQQQATDAASQGREKAQEANQKMAEAAKEWQQKRQDAIKQQREAAKGITAQVLQKQEAITKNEEARDSMALNRQKAEMERTNAVNDVELNCHAQAIGQVEKWQAERMVMERGRIYNRGGFNQMMRNVGISDRDAMSDMARLFKSRCMASEITRKAIAKINRAYNQVLKEADKGERGLDKRRAGLVTEINQLQSKGGCNLGGTGMDPGGMSTETQACQALRTASEDMSRVDADYRIQQKLNRDALMNARSDANSKTAAKQKELALAQNALGEETARLRNLREYLALKQGKAPGGVGIEGKDAFDTRNKHAVMVGSATALASCFTEEKCSENESCKSAAAYLRTIGQKVNYARQSPPAVPPPGPNQPVPFVQPTSTPHGGSK